MNTKKLDMFLESVEKEYSEDTTDRIIKGKGKARIFFKTPQNGNIRPLLWIERVSGSIDGFPEQLLPQGSTIAVTEEYYNSVDKGDLVNVVFVPTFYTATNLYMDLEDETKKAKDKEDPKEQMNIWDKLNKLLKKVGL